MCSDIPRNQLHKKRFGELFAEELHRTLSHISCTPASVACFGELAGCKSELTCCATWVPKMHMANLWTFLVVWVPGAQKRWKTWVYWDVHAWIWNHLSFWRFFFAQVLSYFLRQNWTFSLKLKCVWSVERAMMGVKRDKWWAWAGPINSRNAYKTRENQQDHNRPHHRDWPQSGPNITSKQGKKRQKDKWLHFHAVTSGVPDSKKC